MLQATSIFRAFPVPTSAPCTATGQIPSAPQTGWAQLEPLHSCLLPCLWGLRCSGARWRLWTASLGRCMSSGPTLGQARYGSCLQVMVERCQGHQGTFEQGSRMLEAFRGAGAKCRDMLQPWVASLGRSMLADSQAKSLVQCCMHQWWGVLRSRSQGCAVNLKAWWLHGHGSSLRHLGLRDAYPARSHTLIACRACSLSQCSED